MIEKVLRNKQLINISWLLYTVVFGFSGLLIGFYDQRSNKCAEFSDWNILNGVLLLFFIPLIFLKFYVPKEQSLLRQSSSSDSLLNQQVANHDKIIGVVNRYSYLVQFILQLTMVIGLLITIQSQCSSGYKLTIVYATMFFLTLIIFIVKWLMRA